jgi:3-deoxy-D-manno-octulosonic-acid transferase
MWNFYDIAYAGLLTVGAPFWAVGRASRAKVLDALRTRSGRTAPRTSTTPAVMVHAVSVGELNAARGLIDQLQLARPGLNLIITTTTRTGDARAREIFAGRPDVSIARFPLDFSSMVNRFFDAVRPSAIVLMELEVWPNLMKQAARRGIPVLLANGRITKPSYDRYRRAGPITRRMFRRLRWTCAQDDVYAERFVGLGVSPDRLSVTGSMKFDTAFVGSLDQAEPVVGTNDLARAMNLDRSGPVWVCGSTGPGEESIVLTAYQELCRSHPRLQLAIIPRHPERFGEVAGLIEAAGFSVVRRSKPGAADSSRPVVLLGDTMGELRKFYALADVVFVGRSLVDLGPRQHGSDMIEPAALGKPVLVGPFTGNFEEPVRALKSADAIVEVLSSDELTRSIVALLHDGERRTRLGVAARQVVSTHRGATEKLLAKLLEHLP